MSSGSCVALYNEIGICQHLRDLRDEFDTIENDGFKLTHKRYTETLPVSKQT